MNDMATQVSVSRRSLLRGVASLAALVGSTALLSGCDAGSDGLRYPNPDSRVSREHDDEGLRTVELETVAPEGFEGYDTVFVGYPIWWGITAWPTDGFVSGNDFTGKRVIPFCTSASSPLGESGTNLEALAGTGEWLEGQRFSGGASEDDVAAWLDTLSL